MPSPLHRTSSSKKPARRARLISNSGRKMRLLIALFLSVGFATAGAAEKPKAPSGFAWKAFKEAYCEIQIPDGWVTQKRTQGLAKVVLVSPIAIADGKGIDTGFTINTVKCRSQQEWQEAMELAGRMMSDIRKATADPVESRVEDNEDVALMVIQGERFIPDAPHPEKKYHTRVIVRAFPKFATIYMYSFGAPADEWEEAWKKGSVMLGPVFFTLRK